MRPRLDFLFPHFRACLAVIASAGWGAIVLLSVLPGSARPHTGAGGISEHAIAYAGVALLGGCSTLSLARRLWIGAGLTLTAAALEVAQFIIPGRNAELRGFIAGASGAWAAVLLLLVYMAVWRFRARH